MTTSTMASREGAAAAATARTRPFMTMRSFSEEMDRFFREMAATRWPFQMRSATDEGFWTPAIEMLEREGRLIVRAELPGLSAKDLTVALGGDALTISGERRHAKEEHADTYFRSERSYGRFERTIALPDSVKPDTAKATFNQGVLEISFDAAAIPASRTLSIEESAAGTR